MRVRTVSPKKQIALAAALLCVGLLYGLLHQRYYISYVDDAWCVSQVRFFFNTGHAEDYLFRPVGAPDRVLVFGKSYFYLYGAFLNRLGWTKSNALILSSLLIWLSAGVWVFICRRLNFSPTLVQLLPLSMLVFPAYFNAANLARYDALVFCLASISFLCFLRGRYLLSGVVLVVAMECHPTGIVAAFYILAYVISDRAAFFAVPRKAIFAIGLFGAGAALGLAYVLWLHPDVSIEQLRTTLALKRSMGGFQFGFIVKYFTQSYWLRHVWELPLIVGALALFIKEGLWKRHAFVAIFLATMIAFSVAIGRANANYMIFAYPAFSILIFVTFEELRLLGKLVPAVGAALLILYGSIYALNRGFDFDRITAETAASLVDKNIPVIGMPDNWFAVPDREFHPIYPSVSNIPSLGLKEFYLVRNDYISGQSNNYEALVGDLQRTDRCVLTDQFRAFGKDDVDVFQCKERHHYRN